MPTLDFRGKKHIYAHHYAVPHRPLVPDPERSVGECPDGDNLIIRGDNLHALKALLPRYADRVKCIYIDPPYNTGNEGWIYNDNVNGPVQRNWLKENGLVDNEDLMRHDKWLCMMWPRLHLLKELLAEDGVIFVSIDDNELHHLRMLMNEIFGERNFIATFVWNHRRSKQNDIHVSLAHNYLLTYSKEPNRLELSPLPIEESKYSNPDQDPRGPWTADPMDAQHIRPNLTYEIVNPNTGDVHLPPPGRCWRFSQDKFSEALANNRIVFGKRGKSRPQYKRFLSEARQRGMTVSTLWNDVGTATSATQDLRRILGGDRRFDTPKPVELLMRLFSISTKTDDIVVDSFAGSGTTAQAVLELNKKDSGNRKFILVECEDYADSITAERVRRVIAGVPDAKDEQLRTGLGGSFTYCTLGEPVTSWSMLTGETLPSYAALAAWLMHTATGRAVQSSAMEPLDEYGLIHRDEARQRNYYLHYQPDMDWLESDEAVIDMRRALAIGNACAREGAEAVVFAAGKYMSQDDLVDLNISFCQLPWTVRRDDQV